MSLRFPAWTLVLLECQIGSWTAYAGLNRLDVSLKKRHRRFCVIYYTDDKYKIRAKVVVFSVLLPEFQTYF